MLGQYIPLVYHYNMLQDEDRVGAFLDAVNYLVKPDMHVVELGGGTGILSSFAARLGARVSCVERNPELVACARRFVEANGLDDRITVIQDDASEFVPDSPVDVVICEMLHVGLLREKQSLVISAFKKNYASVYGPHLPVFIPEASILMSQLVEHSFEFAGYVAPVPMFQAPMVDQPRTRELSALLPYASLAYHEPLPTRFDASQRVETQAAGTVNAVRFVTQNVLTINMQQQRAIVWPNQCLVLPLETPIDVQANQACQLTFGYPSGGSIDELSASLQVM